MQIPLTEAPFDTPLVLHTITDTPLEGMLTHLGLFPGKPLVRETEEVLLCAVRVRSAKGDVVLGGKMAMRVVVHLDEGERLPLTDMRAGQTGHIEGTTCPAHLTEILELLGLGENAPITYLRELPHMDYTILVNGRRRERLSEGMAAKIWGRTGDTARQFILAGKDQPFTVDRILSGKQAALVLAEKGIEPGAELKLETVAPSQTFAMAAHEPVVISTKDGLHLHLWPAQAENIRVEKV